MFKLINKRPSILKRKADLFHQLFSNSIKTYIMGRNEYSDILIEIFQKDCILIEGIIDDFTCEKSYKNFPVYKTKEIESNSLIIVCVIEAKLITAIKNIQLYGISNILTYFDLVMYDDQRFPQTTFCRENIYDLKNNIEEYYWLFSQLEDENSRETLKNILDFRFNFDPSVMENFSFCINEQYFDVFPLSKHESFIDCGGFDGTTTLKFIELNPYYDSIHVFEPSPDYFQKTYSKLKEFPNITFYPFATYNKNTTLKFNSEKGSSSGLSDSGNIEVKTVCLDDLIHEKITFLKLDVEGAEYETLMGAERLIKKYKPKIAVCVYHNQKDFWRIPRLLKEYNPNYQIYLRHYTEGFLETVMYFR